MLEFTEVELKAIERAISYATGGRGYTLKDGDTDYDGVVTAFNKVICALTTGRELPS